MLKPSGTQIRAARALAGWDRPHLAKVTGLNRTTLLYIEQDKNSPKDDTIQKIVSAFKNAGIEFIENDGVRRSPTGIEVFEGRDQFETFMTFMYEYLEQFGGEICVYVQDEGLLQRTRKNIDAHRARMAALVKAGKITGRILSAKGVDQSEWAEIRRIPINEDEPHVSFLTFGDNLALISFDHKNPPYVVLHKSGPFARVYKNIFAASWEKAAPPI